MPSLILASSSPRRAELLRQLTPNFKVVPSMVAEIHHDQLSVREAAQKLDWIEPAPDLMKRF